jgi:hypothetical protein
VRLPPHGEYFLLESVKVAAGAARKIEEEGVRGGRGSKRRKRGQE